MFIFEEYGASRGRDTLGKFFTILHKGDNFCDFMFAFLYTKALIKRIYSKMKEFAPYWEQILSF